MKKIETRSNINARVKIPGSKSITHRALIVAGLAKGQSRLESFLECEDTLYTLKALRDMGIKIEVKGDVAIVLGNSGIFRTFKEKKEIFLGNSGTSYRLLLSVAALGKGEYIFTGSPRMNLRPIGDLVNALKGLGVEACYVEKDGFPPVSIKANGIRGGSIRISGGISSQFISSLLLSSPYSGTPVEIEIVGPLVSRPYVDITLDVMKAFGLEVEQDGHRFFGIPNCNRYECRDYTIEGDVSSASYFWGASAITQGRITTDNIHHDTTRQGDIAFLDILEQMGCYIEREKDCVIMNGAPLTGVDVDMGAMPDMVPTLAAIALFAKGKTSIHNVPHLRDKESDRIGDTAMELRKIGGKVEELEDGLIIQGGQRLFGAEIDPHNDHRLAMSLAMVGLMVPGIHIMNENCVHKSFPTFWDLWDEF